MMTLDTALRLVPYFGLQMDYDLDSAEDELADRINRERQVYPTTNPS